MIWRHCSELVWVICLLDLVLDTKGPKKELVEAGSSEFEDLIL